MPNGALLSVSGVKGFFAFRFLSSEVTLKATSITLAEFLSPFHLEFSSLIIRLELKKLSGISVELELRHKITTTFGFGGGEYFEAFFWKIRSFRLKSFNFQQRTPNLYLFSPIVVSKVEFVNGFCFFSLSFCHFLVCSL